MTPGRPGRSFRLNGRRGRAGPAQTSSTVASGEHCRSSPSRLRAGNARAVQRLIRAAEEAQEPARHGGWLLESATAEGTHRHKAGLQGGKGLHPGFAIARPPRPSVVGPPRPIGAEPWFPTEGGAGASWIRANSDCPLGRFRAVCFRRRGARIGTSGGHPNRGSKLAGIEQARHQPWQRRDRRRASSPPAGSR